MFLYATSSLYHGIPLPRAKTVLRQLDHAAIYLLIAGTYTPFLLVSLRGAWGWSLFALIWALAAIGATIGFGYPGEAITATAIVMFILIVVDWAENRFDALKREHGPKPPRK